MTGQTGQNSERKATNASAKPSKKHIIDGKYEIVRAISHQGNVRLYEVLAGGGVLRKVAWFDITNPTERQAFYTYRSAVRAVHPAGLTDVVARPGAHYAVWQNLSGIALGDWDKQPSKQQEVIDAVAALGEKIAEYGFALADADIVLTEQAPKIGYLRPAPAGRTPKDVLEQNRELLTRLSGGKIKNKRNFGRVRLPERKAAVWWSFIPGVLFLAVAAWLGFKAAEVYLNPPVSKVSDVVGRSAVNAARELSKAGFKVEFNYAESGAQAVGSVIRQEPEAGKDLPVGRLVTLSVNRPTLIAVPRLEDLTLAQAKTPLQESRLKIERIIKADGSVSNTPKGRIMAQMPAAGVNVQRDQKIAVVVSTGIKGKETWISNLKGMTYEQARDNARAAGLVVTTIKRETNDEVENIVLKQDPAPFERVEVGSQVKLTISQARYTAPVEAAGPLPIPPKYVPPPPPEQDPPATSSSQPVPAPSQAASTPAPVSDYVPAAPQSQGSSSSAPAAPAAPTPTPAPAAPPPAAAPTPPPATSNKRSVQLVYTFPQNLPAGTYTISVIDDAGERVIMRADSAQVAGLLAQSREQVTGNAVFVVRANGAEFARVAPR